MERELERRTRMGALECRARDDGTAGKVISGHFAIFDSLSEPVWDSFKEEIKTPAFNRTLKEADDILALIHHDPKSVLGSTAARTLDLQVDKTGLAGSAYPVDSPENVGLMMNMEKGNIRGASFGFFAVSTKWRQENGWDIREVWDLDLVEVTVTAFPAFKATSLGVRSYLEGFKKEDKNLITRALNRIEHKLDIIDEDRDILMEYRTSLLTILPEEKRALIESVVPVAPKVVPLSTWQKYLDIH